jgi:LacI family transcriptional regulator
MKGNLTPRRKVLVVASIAASACFRGVARFARTNNWHLVSDMLYTGAFPRGWSGDGIIALVAYQPELLRHIQGTGAPCVAITITDDYLPFPGVGGDNAGIGHMAADHLLERSYRSFAWAPFLSDAVDRERLAGFESRLAEHGHMCYRLPPLHRRIGGYWHDDCAEHRRSLVASLRQLTRPAAIFASNDCVAADLIDACRDAGIVVPDEIAVIGVGNDETLCETVPVPLSSVALDIEEMAHRAAMTLHEVMRGNTVPELVRVAPKGVITRISTDIRAVSNPQVAQVLSYIAEHYPEPGLSVAGVAEVVGLSRRHLERSFRNETGCTIHEYIVKRRMQEASRLLRTHPRAKIAAIAELVGLDGARSFFRTFRRFFGESPGLHRQGAARSDRRAAEPEESARESA